MNNKINHNYARLLEAMEFTPEKWEVTGVRETNTAARCSCGHDIVYNFPLRHKETGRVIPIGSVCIEHAPFIPPELAHQYKAIVARLKAERKAAEELRRQTIKGELNERFNKNWQAFKLIHNSQREIADKLFGPEYNAEGKRQFYKDIWAICDNRRKLLKKKLKTAKGWIKVYTQAIDNMVEFNNKYKLAMILFSSNVQYDGAGNAQVAS